MKPQFLQDAIKANAMKKIQNREKGEWKEPVVKCHKMTAEEFKAAKQLEKPRSFMAPGALPAACSSGPDPQTMKLMETLQSEMKLLRTENGTLKQDIAKSNEEISALWNDINYCSEENRKVRQEFAKLNEEYKASMTAFRTKLASVEQQQSPTRSVQRQSSDNSTTKLAGFEASMNMMKSEIKKLRSDMLKMKEDMVSLQKENKNLKEEVKYRELSSNTSSAIANKTITSPKKKNTDDVKKDSTPTISKATTVTATKNDADKKKSTDKTTDDKVDIHIEPFTPEKLQYHQRKDDVFQKYIKTKEGLYPMKKMSIHDVGSSTIVCFKNRVYIPEKLREKTIQHYQKAYSTSMYQDKIQEYCIWPNMERDILMATTNRQ